MPQPQTSLGSQIEVAIRSACRRRLFVLALEQLAPALLLILAGAVLILLLGTDILNLWWLFLLSLGGLTFAIVRMKRRELSGYRVAQIVDRRLHLSDSLSTAFFLLSNKDTHANPIARFQIEHAAKIAERTRISRAFPLRGGRTWALTGALASVTFGLFAVRYLVTDSLSLKTSLIPLHFGAVLESSLSFDERRMPDGAGNQSPTDEQLRNATSGDREQMDAAEKKADQSPDAQSRTTQADSQRRTDSESRDGDTHSSEQQNSTGKAAANKSISASADSAHPEQGGSTGEQSANGDQRSSGLLDKMKDALSSLLAKMRSNQSLEKSSQNQEQAQNDSARGKASQSTDKRGQQDAQASRLSEDQSSTAQAQGQTTEKPQASAGNSSGQSPQNGSEAHSGIGRQDGDKALKEAEQLKAMGKLAEIIGKRAAGVTGEIAVETASGKQQLKTAYSQRLGHHADLGGEINRDEIPIQDQQYIREYMELVRKQPPKNEP